MEVTINTSILKYLVYLLHKTRRSKYMATCKCSSLNMILNINFLLTLPGQVCTPVTIYMSFAIVGSRSGQYHLNCSFECDVFFLLLDFKNHHTIVQEMGMSFPNFPNETYMEGYVTDIES